MIIWRNVLALLMAVSLAPLLQAGASPRDNLVELSAFHPPCHHCSCCQSPRDTAGNATHGCWSMGGCPGSCTDFLADGPSDVSAAPILSRREPFPANDALRSRTGDPPFRPPPR